MQNEYKGNIPPETPGVNPATGAASRATGRERPPLPHTKVYWAVGALVVVLIIIFAMTARPPGAPLPDETAPAVMPSVPPGSPSDITPPPP